jgi:hypothetical protein
MLARLSALKRSSPHRWRDISFVSRGWAMRRKKNPRTGAPSMSRQTRMTLALTGSDNNFAASAPDV